MPPGQSPAILGSDNEVKLPVDTPPHLTSTKLAAATQRRHPSFVPLRRPLAPDPREAEQRRPQSSNSAGTLPPFSDSAFIKALCRNMFILALSCMSPV